MRASGDAAACTRPQRPVLLPRCPPLPLPCSFWLREPWVHDLSLDQFAELTVFSNGGGGNINFDCHRAGEKQKHDWFAAAVFVPKRGGGGGGGGGGARGRRGRQI